LLFHANELGGNLPGRLVGRCLIRVYWRAEAPQVTKPCGFVTRR